MDDSRLVLTRRRLLGSIFFMGVGGAGLGAGTTAYFRDSESSTNSIQAGTLDLKLDGSADTATFLTEENVVPGDGSTESLLLRNIGSVDGSVTTSIASIQVTDAQNGQVQMDEELLLSAEIEGPLTTEEVFSDETLADLQQSGISHNPVQIPNSESATFRLTWLLPEDTHNQARSDVAQIDFAFELTQLGGT